MVKIIGLIIILLLFISCISEEMMYRNLYSKIENFNHNEIFYKDITFNEFYKEEGLYETRGEFNIIGKKKVSNSLYINILYIRDNGMVFFSTEENIKKLNIKSYKELSGILLRKKNSIFIERVLTTKMNLGEGVSHRYKIKVKNKKIYMQIEGDRCLVYSLIE